VSSEHCRVHYMPRSNKTKQCTIYMQVVLLGGYGALSRSFPFSPEPGNLSSLSRLSITISFTPKIPFIRLTNYCFHSLPVSVSVMATLHQHPARTNLSRAHHGRASAKKQRVVSAASVFKKRPKQTKKPTSLAKEAIAEAVRASVEVPPLALVREPEVAVLQPASSSSPQKQVSRLKRTRSSEKHPLVVAFKGMSNLTSSTFSICR
jgi:hypothetical protein